jgi:hypothetical protein
MKGSDIPLDLRPKLETRDAGPAFLLDIVNDRDSTPTPAARAAREGLTAMTAGWRPPSNNPPDLVGRTCPCPPPEWHLQRLFELAGRQERPGVGADHARRRYHARWLGHLLMPDHTGFRPLVTILIPVYNRAALTAEAVESCLAQTWRPLEILVVDDGSDDDLAGALARFGDAVRVVRQANGGVSSARNAGIRLARGDFVHFLDSDNLLMPMAVARKVDGFARFPDAELCYSLAEIEGDRQPDLPRTAPPSGAADCPTVSLLLAGSTRFPFYVSCVMLPRFTLLETGGFEEDLRRGEDTRFWTKLALRDSKVIGLDARLTVRRLSNSSLSGTPLPPLLQLVIRSRTLADLLGTPRAWVLAARYVPGLLNTLLRDELHHPVGQPHDGMSPLLAAIRALGDGESREGMSPLPLLAHMRHLIPRGPGLVAVAGRELAQLRSAVDTAVRGAAPMTRGDIAFWARAAISRTGKRRLSSFCAHAEGLLEKDGALLPVIDELLRGAPGIPHKRAIRSYLRLRRWRVPGQLALRLALRTAR